VHGSLRSRLPGWVLVAALAGAAAVRAEDADKAREHYAVALQAYDLGKYEEAIAEFQEAYRFKEAPGLLYNIAQAYRLSNRPEEAVRYYRTYLERKPDAVNAADVQGKIDRLNTLIEDRKTANASPAAVSVPKTAQRPANSSPETTAGTAVSSAPAAQPPATAATTDRATAATSAADPPARSAAPPPRAPSLAIPSAPAASAKAAPAEAVAARSPEKFWTARKAGWIATGLGAAALAFAVYFGVEARSASSEMESAAAAGRPFDPSVESKGQRAQTLSRVLLASAAVGFGAGGILLGTSGRSPIDAAALASSEESR
jgi:tetratricopeptide (TPR) repeat protein